MHLGNRYSSLTRIVFCIYKIRKFVRNYSRTAVLCCPWTFSEGTLCQTFFGYKSKFLKKMSLNFSPWKNRKKSNNSLSLRDQTQSTRNILKIFLHIFINGGFKLFVILSFIIADDLKGELLI